MKFHIGLESINSYQRLNYTAWHALAEFVDNSTQAYFDNKEILDNAFKQEGKSLEVSILYDRTEGTLEIRDTSIGMSEEELDEALKVANKPPKPTGRSRYGMGLKTAACWFGDKWSVKTKKLGHTKEITVEVDVKKVASGQDELPPKIVEVGDTSSHYTVVKISELHSKMSAPTIGKVKQFLASMYRFDLEEGQLKLYWQSSPIQWTPIESAALKAADGSPYKKEFRFEVHGKQVNGWVAVLDKGSRSLGGFSIIQNKRMIHGYPQPWKPHSLYGQEGGSNDLINQRLVGLIHLDGFEVSHQKDRIVWRDDEESLVEKGLEENCGEYRTVARDRRKGQDQRGPTQVEVDTAIDQVVAELSSDQLVDALTLRETPPPEIVDDVMHAMVDTESKIGKPRIDVVINGIRVRVYLSYTASPNDPYYAFDFPNNHEIIEVLNMSHPYVKIVRGADGFANYLRQCIFDAVAEFRAMLQKSPLHSNSIRMHKDFLLRVPLEVIDEHVEPESDTVVDEDSE